MGLDGQPGPRSDKLDLGTASGARGLTAKRRSSRASRRSRTDAQARRSLDTCSGCRDACGQSWFHRVRSYLHDIPGACVGLGTSTEEGPGTPTLGRRRRRHQAREKELEERKARFIDMRPDGTFAVRDSPRPERQKLRRRAISGARRTRTSSESTSPSSEELDQARVALGL